MKKESSSYVFANLPEGYIDNAYCEIPNVWYSKLLVSEYRSPGAANGSGGLRSRPGCCKRAGQRGISGQAELADELGFAVSTSFQPAFKSWTGNAPLRLPAKG